MEKKKTTLAQAMLDFRVNVDSVTKDSTNPFFNSGYTSYNAVRETINPTLDMLGIVVIQAPMILEGIDVLNTKVYMAHNPSDFICSNIRLLIPKGDMQQLGACITYAKRYSLVSLFGLAEEDDDGNKASEHPSIPTWENANQRKDVIVDARIHVDQDEMQEALDLLEKTKLHWINGDKIKDNAIVSKRGKSLWAGIGKEYQVKLRLFEREQK
jgi:hypothetical protein